MGLPASLSSRMASADRDNRQKPKLSLSTDFGNPAHWDRVVEFATKHEVSRLVYWGEDSPDIFIYPRRPKLLPEQSRAAVEEGRGYFRSAAEKTVRAGMEFWCVFQVLQFPTVSAVQAVWNRPPLDHVRQAAPELFNKYGEPDMEGGKIYEYIGDQVSELRGLAP